MDNESVKNVLEFWPLYDTVLIGVHTDLYPKAGYFIAYGNLGAVAEIPFFNIRNRSMVGVPYNNFDTTEHLTFPYHCDSIGVEFITAVSATSTTGFSWLIGDLVFGKLLQNHASLKFIVDQDEKLVCTVPLCPAGMGIDGDASDGGSDDHANYGIDVANNGSPILTNRWKFPQPIIIPRNATIRATIEFSPYARNVLNTMVVGPGVEYVGAAQTNPQISAIRVSMFGRREVQQRGQLHFR